MELKGKVPVVPLKVLLDGIHSMELKVTLHIKDMPGRVYKESIQWN